MGVQVGPGHMPTYMPGALRAPNTLRTHAGCEHSRMSPRGHQAALKGCFVLGQCQARIYTAVPRHILLVMTALAICAVTAAQLRNRTDAQVPRPQPAQARHRQPTQASPRSLFAISSACSPPPQPPGAAGQVSKRLDAPY
jgi:hypothetical protein